MTNTIEPAADIGIVEKLLAWDRGIPDFIGDKNPICETVSYRNPDGPEAAAIIMEMVEALEEVRRVLTKTATGRIGGDDMTLPRSMFDSVVRKLDATLAKVRSK